MFKINSYMQALGNKSKIKIEPIETEKEYQEILSRIRQYKSPTGEKIYNTEVNSL